MKRYRAQREVAAGAFFQNSWPVRDYHSAGLEVARCFTERDAERVASALNAAEGAVARAEEAERDLRLFQAGLTDVLRAYNVPAMPSWSEAIHWLAKHGSDASPR